MSASSPALGRGARVRVGAGTGGSGGGGGGAAARRRAVLAARMYASSGGLPGAMRQRAGDMSSASLLHGADPEAGGEGVIGVADGSGGVGGAGAHAGGALSSSALQSSSSSSSEAGMVYGLRDDGSTGAGGSAGGAPPRPADFSQPAAGAAAAGLLCLAVLPEGYRYAAFALSLCAVGLIFSGYLRAWLLSKDDGR